MVRIINNKDNVITDEQVQILAEHLTAGMKLTVIDVKKHYRCSIKVAEKLLERAQNKAKEQLYVRKNQKQVENYRERQKQRQANRSTRRSRDY